jgi:hypothetical protein
VAPSPVIKLGIEEDRFLIEVGDQGGIDLAAVDRLQNGDHGFRWRKAPDIDMDGVRRPPYPGFFLGPSASHETPHHAFSDKSVPQYLNMRYGLVSDGNGDT